MAVFRSTNFQSNESSSFNSSTNSLPTLNSSSLTSVPLSSLTSATGICSVWPYGSHDALILSHAYNEGRNMSPPMTIAATQFVLIFFMSVLKIFQMFLTSTIPIHVNGYQNFHL